MEKRLTMILASLFLCVGMALAQTAVTGTVVSQEDGQPVIGATVRVPGSNTGAVTDVDGKFTISAPQGAELSVSYIGMKTVTVKAANNMKVTLEPDDASLDELVPGTKGILEPADDAPALTEPAQLVGSVCLVPGLVFDGAGHRGGYGGGYYDRFLAFYPGDKIGLARTGMISSNPLPVEKGDVPVDFIATEFGVWSCRGR